jgi:hypothetical protein
MVARIVQPRTFSVGAAIHFLAHFLRTWRRATSGNSQSKRHGQTDAGSVHRITSPVVEIELGQQMPGA